MAEITEKIINEENPFLEINDLVVEYTANKKTVHAVNNVSLSLKKGHTLGLAGETGAGKTTICKSILQILPEYNSKIVNGEIKIDGENLLEKSAKEMQKIRGKKVAMIFQDPMTALNPVKTVGIQIAEVVSHHYKLGLKESLDRAEEMLELVGIPGDRLGEYPHQFSGGMKQRVVIAIALACQPELLIADEPTTALDVTIQLQVLELIKKLRDDFGTSMILVTHDLGVIAEVCDDVDIIYAGEIVEAGTKEDIFVKTAHPYTKGLFDSIPHIDQDVERLDPIEGLPPDPTNLPEGCHFSPRCPYATEECRSGDIPMIEIEPGHFCRCIHHLRGEK